MAPEWGWAWPANRRILYNRASADPDGKPWSERKRYVWWDAEKERWTGEDVPDFQPDKAPDYVPPPGAKAEDQIAGTHPFIMQADGRGWLFAPAGLVDGPLPTHYEPHESAVLQPPLRRSRRTRRASDSPGRGNRTTRATATPAARYPYVFTTYRLTEHHTAGGMSRSLPHLAELQPEMFCEVSPELAAERGLEHGGWATISTSRAAIEARVMVSERMRPLEVQGRQLHQIGLPYHWGSPRPRDRRFRQRPAARRPRRERAHPGEQGRDLRHPARPANARWTMTIEGLTQDWAATYGDRARERVGFFTDTTVCIGCKACEVACKEWNGVPEDGLPVHRRCRSTTPARSAPAPGATSPSSSSRSRSGSAAPTATPRTSRSAGS